MKKLGVISSFTLSAVLAIAAIPAGAQTDCWNKQALRFQFQIRHR